MNNRKPAIIRACTASQSIGFVVGMLPDLMREYDVEVLSSPGAGWTSLDAFGDKVKRIEVSMERHISPWRDLKALLHLIKVFRREKPLMVHSMTPKAGLLCMMAAKITGVPVRVHTFTGLVFPTATGITKKILISTDRLTCACATHIIPEGEGVKRDLLANGITRKPIRVLGHGNCQGIDLDRFDRTPEVISAADKIRRPDLFTFIAVGRVVGDKGINELVSAFKRLNTLHPSTRLILVGGYEPDLDPLRADTVRDINEHPAIEAVGKQEDVRPWFAAADCAILASYREGFPNVVIEAGAMGLPQIVTDINGANEIIIEGQNGIIIPSKDTDALYAALERILTDRALRETLAANARAMIASRYEQTYVRRCLIDYYHQILKHV